MTCLYIVEVMFCCYQKDINRSTENLQSTISKHEQKLTLFVFKHTLYQFQYFHSNMPMHGGINFPFLPKKRYQIRVKCQFNKEICCYRNIEIHKGYV